MSDDTDKRGPPSATPHPPVVAAASSASTAAAEAPAVATATATASDAPCASPVSELGAPPADVTFKVAAVDGRVVVRFDTLLQWLDVDPETAVNFAEVLIRAATAAANDRLIVAAEEKKLILPGLPN